MLLCMQPQVFRKMRADLASMWSPNNKARNQRRMLARASASPFDEKSVSVNYEGSIAMDEDMKGMKVTSCLFASHIPFLDVITCPLTFHLGVELAICIDKYLICGDISSLISQLTGNTLPTGPFCSFYLSHFLFLYDL